ncbi:hypothetical protein MNBD_ALPHA02-87, partial [hydrothermal vent metagenome]
MSIHAGGVKKYIVRLSNDERTYLETIIGTGRDSAGRLLKARILLKADIGAGGAGWQDGRITEALETSLSTVQRLRRRFVEEGLEAALSRKKRARPPITPIFDGEAEARLIQLACSEPPAGHGHWSLRLLERKVVELGIVDAANDSTIGIQPLA